MLVLKDQAALGKWSLAASSRHEALGDRAIVAGGIWESAEAIAHGLILLDLDLLHLLIVERLFLEVVILDILEIEDGLFNLVIVT